MDINKCIKGSFSVIGKQGSTNHGKAFIQDLWTDANAHFNEVADLTHSFRPWEDNFTKGLYLAGVEVNDDAEAPIGWVKWTIPSYEYLYVKNENLDTFVGVINYLEEHKINLVGAVHDFTCPESGQQYMFFPIRRV